jgi:hypothetical protein
MAALRLAAEAGVKLTAMVQVAPTASEEPQLLVSPKLEALVPVTAMLVMLSAALPGLDNVMGSAVAETPTVVLGNASGLGASTACGAVPVPVSETAWGDPAALSAMEREAVRLPAEAGVKATVMVQVAAAASDAPQLLVCAKLPAFVPLMEMPEMVKAAVPGLDSVTGRLAAELPTAVLEKASGLGLSVACGVVPVPVRDADCGEPVALSATERTALKLEAEAGLKVTLMVQEAEAASDAPQLLVWEKSAALAPVTEMLLMVRAALPGFESVRGSAAPADPTIVPGKARGDGLSTAWGAAAGTPVPLRVKVTACAGPPPELVALSPVATLL